jgi:hypothetical protein
MNKERLYRGIDAITDQDWGFLKVWGKDYEGSIHPNNISKGEAQLLKILGRLLPERIMPFVVRQWGGEEGEEKFKENITR